MARPIEHRSSYDAPAGRVHAVLVDADYLSARLAELGGKDPELTEHAVDGDRARLGTRSSVPVEFLPSVIRRLTGGDLVLDRVETWEPGGDGGFTGTVEVTVRGLPGRITGTHTLRDEGDGSVYALDGRTDVPVPLVAGRIEGVVNEQVGALLAGEDDFLRRRLAGS